MADTGTNAFFDGALANLRDPMIEGEIDTIRDALASFDHAVIYEALVRLEESVAHIRQRYADKELVRAGHIIRHLAETPKDYYAAVEAARAEHPEAWNRVLPIHKPKDELDMGGSKQETKTKAKR